MSLTLLDWRRQIADLYRDVRSQTAGDPAATLARFREGRRRLFATHPDSPIDDDRPPPEYWPWRRELRFEVVVDTTTTPVGGTTVEDSAGESAPFRRFGTVHLPVGDLDVYWLTSYGGGVFLPFGRDERPIELWRRSLPSRHRQGCRPRWRPRNPGGGFQLRLPPVVLLQRSMGVPVGPAWQSAPRPHRGRGATAARLIYASVRKRGSRARSTTSWPRRRGRPCRCRLAC